MSGVVATAIVFWGIFAFLIAFICYKIWGKNDLLETFSNEVLGGLISLALTIIVFLPLDNHIESSQERIKVVNVYSTGSPSIESGFSFGWFGHLNGRHSVISYLVRIKVDGGYKDMIIEDVVLSENDRLIGRGEYITINTCTNSRIQSKYLLFWTYKSDDLVKTCVIKSQFLSLPVGSVRHVLSV